MSVFECQDTGRQVNKVRRDTEGQAHGCVWQNTQKIKAINAEKMQPIRALHTIRQIYKKKHQQQRQIKSSNATINTVEIASKNKNNKTTLI